MLTQIYMMKVSLITLFITTVSALNVFPRNIEGTETINGLTSKQLAIQRWFSQITYLQELDDWNGWGDVVNDVHCDGNWCIRYELAGLAYAAGALALKTPAYTSTAEKILYNAILRMTDKVVYQYIEIFNDFIEQPTFPDPVVYKNIMYSAHLAQMISLYESISGDLTFTTTGWQFDWGETSDFPTPISYNTSKLIENMFKQSQSYEIGGVPCEPDSIFIICNNYMVNALHLYDTNHNTSYESVAGPVWQSTVEKKGIKRIPAIPGMDNNYFVLDYLIKPLGIWEPIASVGSDVWALAWMKTWWNPHNSMESSKKLLAAWDAVYNSAQWVSEADNDNYTTMRLHSTDLSNKLMPFNDMIITSFYPMIERQFFTVPCVAEGVCVSKMEPVFRYFENSMGVYFDSDGDGVNDSYHYNTEYMNDPQCGDQTTKKDSNDVNCVIGNYTVWVTANLLMGMLTEEFSETVLQELFQYSTDTSGTSYYQRHVNQPKVLEVDYPRVMVSEAVYSPQSETVGILKFTLVAGDGCASYGTTLTVTLKAKFEAIHLVTLNGERFNAFAMNPENENQVVVSALSLWKSCDNDSKMEFIVYFSD